VQKGACFYDLTAPPVLTLAPDGIEFEAVQNGTLPASRSVTFSVRPANTATDPVGYNITYQGGATGWLTGVLDPPAARSLQPSTTALPPGTYTALVSVTALMSSNVLVTSNAVTVTYRVLPGAND
jgi:hypothetical protein